MNTPKVTIITAVLNGEKHIEETIKSIVNQDYGNFEYIIIDGGSTDRTVDIIKRYEEKVKFWVSEKDEGISDAFNKGLKASSGEYINFQGDGDRLFSFDTLSKVFRDHNFNHDTFISGRIERVSEEGCSLFLSKFITDFDKKSLLFKLSIPHQGLFTHKSFYEKYGDFDLENVFCMDYEILLRAYHDFPNVITKDVVVSKWRDDGIGNGRTLEIFKEYNHIKVKNKINHPYYLAAVKNWILFKYYAKKILGIYKKY
jgi:glycosyltransferase involved in cell wall biosynthesis